MPHGDPKGNHGPLFPQLNPLEVDDSDLEILSRAMIEAVNANDRAPDSTTPAGYTYLGQFVDHDITRDIGPALDVNGDPIPGSAPNGRTPVLDLDSLYRGGPGDAPAGIYATDGVHFAIGQTVPSDPFSLHPNDLPRSADGTALIGDDRNDENLAVAQTHLAFLKFHNHIVDARTSRAKTPKRRFEEARRIVTSNYQWVVLNDFLPRIVDDAVLFDVRENGATFYASYPLMPLEFSVAAYRLGHSMVRNTYNWNRVFPIATLSDLFTFTGAGGFFGLNRVPSNWIADWRRMYDTEDAGLFQGHPAAPEINMARPIDTRISRALTQVPLPNGQFLNLALANLRRGVQRGLPSGQDVAAEIKAKLPATPIISSTVMFDGVDTADLNELESVGLHEATPLWYYILREAELFGVDGRLGPVGSRIVAEVFVELIAHSPHSILEPGYDPHDDILGRGRPGPTMATIIAAGGDLNPIGDGDPLIV